ncbi:DsbA family protein [Plantactinospora mayteni]|uniref:DSBA oxidoreductase n=1 Tax=Plantactinospora mayteni TaxID=566021 RepID=A0ABQ4EZD2_9ACTN|nr:DsbA family protein [Plantactinospora mayteni]GIH00016.1 DSBA oxidoreductase [Plantactinospora mayteni]
MEKVTFYFDPRCPWCYQASRWARRLEALGEIELDWALYCLEVANLAEGADPVPLGETARSATALRAAAAIGRKENSRAIGRFYQALGNRVWETGEPAKDRDLAVAESVEEAGFDRSLFAEALADPETWRDVLDQHRHLVTEKGGIGLPTLVLDGGAGPAIFGPVLSQLPNDEDAVKIWRHLSWLARYDNFFELKRHRTEQPNLPGWRVQPSKLTFGSRPWLPPVPDRPAPSAEPAPAPAPSGSATPL